MSGEEFDQFERRWKLVFGVSAAVLAICLIDLGWYFSAWFERTASYSIGAIAALVGLYAAKQLRDVERAQAITDGSWLNQIISGNNGPDLDDD
ncbi:putative membrane protein [Inhella inkyongensis]|uniref:Putative membrane protein n=1 Tax=Inhella inkyongensis TaxID=392593 RepID=A0A840S3Q7_9BURK|nr:hypothetical protein [Inhella inkyongensis]MBB5204985.1 putative membrane protein [Inhella inkyongensis]